MARPVWDGDDAPLTLPIIDLTRPRTVETYAILVGRAGYVWDGQARLEIGAAVQPVRTMSGRVYAVPQRQTITGRLLGARLGPSLAAFWLYLPDATRHAILVTSEDTFVVVHRPEGGGLESGLDNVT